MNKELKGRLLNIADYECVPLAPCYRIGGDFYDQNMESKWFDAYLKYIAIKDEIHILNRVITREFKEQVISKFMADRKARGL